MAEKSFEEKTEQPTPKKREEVRRKGQVAKSRELPSIAVLLSGLLMLAACASYMYKQMETVLTRTLSGFPGQDVNTLDVMTFAKEITAQFILLVAPVMAAVFVAALLANIVQVGFMVSGEALRPKLSKLSPLKGLARLFSAQSAMELFKSLAKLLIVGGVAYLAIHTEIKGVHRLADMEIAAMVSAILYANLKIFLKCTLAMIVIVGGDYAFQRWQFEKQIRMTKKEIKDELKRTEGDPLIKSRIRSIQMEMARRRMMQEVPKADVVVTNPTHFAVAVKYDGRSMKAPKLVAKGADEVARKIKEIALAHGVPVVENRELARSLFSLVKIGHEIPASLYQAVAEVLAYIYKLKHAKPAM